MADCENTFVTPAGENIDEQHVPINIRKGSDVQPQFAFKFIYKAALDHDLTEHEYDHVFTGTFNGTPVVNNEEVDGWKFVAVKDLLSDLSREPEKYTPWLKLILQQIDKNMRSSSE